MVPIPEEEVAVLPSEAQQEAMNGKFEAERAHKPPKGTLATILSFLGWRRKASPKTATASERLVIH